MRSKEFSNSCFFNALVELLDTKEFEEIQIQEICMKAGYNRSTFYRSFKTKVDVLLYELKKELNKYHDLVAKSQDYSFKTKTKLLFDAIKDSSNLLLIAHKAGLEKELYDLFYEIYPFKEKDELLYGKYYKPFRAAGIFKTIIQWLTSGMKESTSEMADILFNIIDNCKAEY